MRKGQHSTLQRIPRGACSATCSALLALAGFALCVGGLLDAIGMAGAWWVSGIIGAIELGYLAFVASTHVEDASTDWAVEPTRQLQAVKPKASAAKAA